MGIKGVVEGGLNLVKSNKRANGVLKTMGELFVPDDGINGLVKNTTKRHAKNLLNSTSQISQTYGEEGVRVAKEMADNLNSISGRRYTRGNTGRVKKGTTINRTQMKATKQSAYKGSMYGDYAKTLGGGLGGNFAASAGVAKEYLWSGATKGQRAARIGAVAAGYMGVNAVGRAISGGDLRHNNKGEDDIAGIPFL